MPATKKKTRKRTIRSLQGLAPLRALIAMGDHGATPRVIHSDIRKACPSFDEDPKTIYKHLNSLVRHGLAVRSRDRKHYWRSPRGRALLKTLTIK